jgi:hypothetical protein
MHRGLSDDLVTEMSESPLCLQYLVFSSNQTLEAAAESLDPEDGVDPLRSFVTVLLSRFVTLLSPNDSARSFPFVQARLVICSCLLQV